MRASQRVGGGEPASGFGPRETKGRVMEVPDTMWVAMVWQMSGGRYDDRAWPAPGVPFEVPREEGLGLVGAYAAIEVPAPEGAHPPVSVPVKETVPVSEPAGTAAGPAVWQETVAEKPTFAPETAPPPAAPKQTWIDFAVSCGASEDDAGQMTKADLMSRYGGRV